jgi:hypothetical protein
MEGNGDRKIWDPKASVRWVFIEGNRGVVYMLLQAGINADQ